MNRMQFHRGYGGRLRKTVLTFLPQFKQKVARPPGSNIYCLTHVAAGEPIFEVGAMILPFPPFAKIDSPAASKSATQLSVSWNKRANKGTLT